VQEELFLQQHLLYCLQFSRVQPKTAMFLFVEEFVEQIFDHSRNQLIQFFSEDQLYVFLCHQCQRKLRKLLIRVL
jgi:hypothetical protein